MFTRDNTGVTKIYIDGTQVTTDTASGNTSNWAAYQLALAAELDNTRNWHGTYELVAIYDQALTPAEVTQNYNAGPDGDGTQPPQPTTTTRNYYTFNGQTIGYATDNGNGPALTTVATGHLGSTEITNQAGSVARQTYLPFGDIRNGAINGLGTDRTYTGQVDDGLGWMHYRARQYDPTLGRFMRADPLAWVDGETVGLNRYTYVLNNPNLLIDPTGHLPGMNPATWGEEKDALESGAWEGLAGDTPGSGNQRPENDPPTPIADLPPGLDPGSLADQYDDAVRWLADNWRPSVTGLCGELEVVVGFGAGQVQGCVVTDGQTYGLVTFEGAGIGYGKSPGAGGGPFFSGAESVESLAGPGICGDATIGGRVNLGGALCFAVEDGMVVPDSWAIEVVAAAGGPVTGLTYGQSQVHGTVDRATLVTVANIVGREAKKAAKQWATDRLVDVVDFVI